MAIVTGDRRDQIPVLRTGLTWLARPGAAVLLSARLDPPIDLRRPALLTAWAAVSVAETIAALTSLQPTIKWPNDVLIDRRKTCGILIEQMRGVVAGIVPWNVPLFITMLKFAPTLASGSTMVLKPAPETPVSAFVFAELCEEAGVPAGVLNVVPADREVGEHLVTHPGVD